MNYTSYEMFPIKSGKLKEEMEITVQNDLTAVKRQLWIETQKFHFASSK